MSRQLFPIKIGGRLASIALVLCIALLSVQLKKSVFQKALGDDSIQEIDKLLQAGKVRKAERLCRILIEKNIDVGSRLEEIHQRLKSAGFVKIGVLWLRKQHQGSLPKFTPLTRIRVWNIKGQARIQRGRKDIALKRDTPPIKKASPSQIQLGDRINVDKDGLLRLKLQGDRFVTIEEKSQVYVSGKARVPTAQSNKKQKFAPPFPENGSLFLEKGEMALQVGNNDSSKASVKSVVIQTSNALVETSKSRFTIKSHKDRTELRVLTGKVKVRSTIEPEKSKELSAGRVGIVSPLGRLKSRKLNSQERQKLVRRLVALSLRTVTAGSGAVLTNGKKSSTVTPVKSWRQAQNYYGQSGVDRIQNWTDAAGDKRIHVCCDDTGDSVEYLMELGGNFSILEVNAIADRPSPLKINVYIDSVKRGTISFSQNDNRNHTLQFKISPPPPRGTHAVCLVFANDTFIDGLGADGDRNLRLAALRIVKR